MVYDYAKVWHIPENYEDSIRRDKSGDGFIKAICGVYYKHKAQQQRWETCTDCVDDLTKRRRTSYPLYPYYDEAVSARKLPKQIKEKGYKPPMGDLE